MPTHSKFKKNHEESRRSVCVLCFTKTSNSRKFNITYKTAISNILSDFLLKEEHYPCALCSNCRIKIDKKIYITVPDYTDKNLEKNESENSCCDCDICVISRSKPYSSSFKKPKPGRPRITSPKKRLSVCSKCMCVLNKGKPHVCTVRAKINNILNVSGDHKEQVANRVLRNITNQMPSTSSVSMVSLKRDRGVPLNVAVMSKRARLDMENPSVVNVNVLKEIQLENGQNMTQMKRTTRSLRKAKINVKRGVMTQLNTESHDLDAFFTVEAVEVDISKDLKKIMQVVYCCDLNGLVSHLLHKRNIGDSFLCKIGMDGGGGSLKVCVCLWS